MEKCFSSTKSEDYRVRGFDSYDLSGESFTHDNPVELSPKGVISPLGMITRPSKFYSCQQSVFATVSPSCSSNSNETYQQFWIREEDNRDEIASSFSALGLNAPQLVHPTKTRAKGPGTHRPRKNRSSKRAKGFKATRWLFSGKESLTDTDQAGPRTPHTITDSSKESATASCSKDNVRNLRALFEQI